MIRIEEKIAAQVAQIMEELFGQRPEGASIAIQPTRKEFEGDFTLVVFPFVKMARQSPEQLGNVLGQAITSRMEEVESYNVIKGFLNLTLTGAFWLGFLQQAADHNHYGVVDNESGEAVVVEYSSPNTNKPLHLGHIRNNLLGYSVAQILDAAGHKAIKVNLVNDRGIHICKSMLAWMKWGQGETPQSTGKKGDKLVGDYYVRFETELRKEAALLKESQGLDDETARSDAPLMQEARELLRLWEARDPHTVEVWKNMNAWVYEGFDATYQRLGVSFEKIYYESDTYLLGKEIVMEGLEKGVLFRKDDGSVWADLTPEGLDEKLLLRADGTSVYMTQDIGTAQLRYEDYQATRMIYVVGNEQNYHFDVLKRVLHKLDKPYAEHLFHLSYGMVELPEGKMKSREGTVVDADDLMDEMYRTAKETTEALGKIDGFSDQEKEQLFHTIGLGALKYFILKVDPRKNMLFNPAESIDFNGNTGPFIQYTHARIRSIIRRAQETGLAAAALQPANLVLQPKEKVLLQSLYAFPQVVQDAAREMSPAQIANYVYELAKAFNQFYHDHSVLNEPDRQVSVFRLHLSDLTARVIKTAMELLGIEVPEKM